MFKVNNKDSRTKPTDIVAISFGFSKTAQIFYRASEGQIEMKYKQKIKFIVYFEQILQCVLVFLKLTLRR